MSKEDGNDRRVYVGNLPPDIRSKDVEDLFYKYGTISFIDLKNRRGPPFAFVEFEDPRDAEDAVHARDGYDYDGYRLRVEFPKGGGASFRPGTSRSGGKGPPARRSKYRVIISGLPPSGSWQDLKDHMRDAGEVCFSDVFKDGSGAVEYLRSVIQYFFICTDGFIVFLRSTLLYEPVCTSLSYGYNRFWFYKIICLFCLRKYYLQIRLPTVCPRSSGPSYVVHYYIKWVLLPGHIVGILQTFSLFLRLFFFQSVCPWTLSSWLLYILYLKVICCILHFQLNFLCHHSLQKKIRTLFSKSSFFVLWIQFEILHISDVRHICTVLLYRFQKSKIPFLFLVIIRIFIGFMVRNVR